MTQFSSVHARLYWRLWENKAHIVRRIENYNIINQTTTQRSITLDTDWAKVATYIYEEISHELRPQDLPIPMLVIRKGLLLDIDLKDEENRSIHLCRRHVNMDVSAHIVLGLCMAAGYEDDPESLFGKVLFFLGHFRKLSTAEKIAALRDIERTAISGGISRAGFRQLHQLLIQLMDNYIQCIRNSYEECRPLKIFKVRIGVYETDRALNELTHTKVGITQKLGLRATRMDLPLPIGEEKSTHPTHIKLSTPSATTISDCVVVDESFSSPAELSSDDKNLFLVRLGQKNAILLDRGIPSGKYRVILKINPIQHYFLHPATFSVFVFLSLLTVGLFFPINLVNGGSAGYAAALFLAPQAVIAFVVRHNEHEFMYQILSWQRNLLSISSGLVVVAGASLTLLREGATRSQSLTVGFSLVLLVLSLCVNLTTLYFFLFQTLRMWLTQPLRHPETNRTRHLPLSITKVRTVLCSFSIGYILCIGVFTWLSCSRIWESWMHGVNGAPRTLGTIIPH